MLSDILFPPGDEYRTGTDNEPLTSYMEALVESTRLDLLLGYISSSAIRVLSLGFAKFISNGGRALNVYQLDMPDGVSNAFRSEIEITIQKVDC